MRIHNPKISVGLSSGYTLVELLIAMTLGVFLLAGVFQINQANQKGKYLQESIEQTQKNGRFAIDNISYAVKTAGYSGFYGSLSTGVENLLNTPADIKWDISRPITGYNNVSGGDNIMGITGFIPNTDVLLLKGMNGNVSSVVTNANSSTLVAATNSAFTTGDIVVVTDPDQASLFQVSSINVNATTSTLTLAAGAGGPGNSALLKNSFNSVAEIGKYDIQMFYIKNGRNGSPALFKAILWNNGGAIQLQENELASDIRNMQINYGIDTNNNQKINIYEDASAVANWRQLVSINIVLLANSDKNNILPSKSSFHFDSNLITFVEDSQAATLADRRLKRVFRTYLPLRN